jgi:hypothetical protein
MTFKFDHSHDFEVPVTEEFLEHCSGKLSLFVINTTLNCVISNLFPHYRDCTSLNTVCYINSSQNLFIIIFNIVFSVKVFLIQLALIMIILFHFLVCFAHQLLQYLLLLMFFSEGALSIEVWGHRCAGFTKSNEGWEVEQQQLAKARSLADR